METGGEISRREMLHKLSPLGWLAIDVEKCTGAITNGSRLVKEGYQIANETTMLMEKVMDTIEDTSGQIDMVLTSAEDVALFSDDTIKLVKDGMPRMVEQI